MCLPFPAPDVALYSDRTNPLTMVPVSEVIPEKNLGLVARFISMQ